MSHRTVIKVLIVVVIGIVVAWSVVNISDYAHTFHASLVVWTMGAALGTANALSVYAFVMAKTTEVKRPAVIGIILFGGMSGTLQTLLYLQVGAPILAAMAFGWFGPVAEGVLAWLHAALSDEVVKQRKTTSGDVKKTSTGDTGNVKQQQVTVPTPVLTPELTLLIGKSDIELGRQVGVSRQTVYKWRNSGALPEKLQKWLDKQPVHVGVQVLETQKIAEKLPEMALVGTNGHNGFGAH